MTTLKPLKILSLALAIAALSACSTLPKQQPYLDNIQPDIRIDQTQFAPEGDLRSLINSTDLSQQLEIALENNPSLRQIALSLQAIEQQSVVTKANQKPSASAGYNASRSEDSDTQYSGSLSVGWTLDVWRQLADRSQAAEWDVREQQRLYAQARDMLAANVIQAWTAAVVEEREVELVQHQLALLTRIERYTEQRYRLGLGTLENLETARTNVSSQKSTLVQAQRSKAQAYSDLRLLQGLNTEDPLNAGVDFPVLASPLDQFPEQSLWRRPDLQAAYFSVAAADARTRASYKAMLPSFRLEAALKDIATAPADALLSDPVWSLLGQLSAPLYQGGALKASAKSAELNAAKAYEAYRETLLSATEEVALALANEHSYRDQLTHINQALTQAERNVTRYQSKYREGLVELLDLLNIQKQRYSLESQRNNVLQQQLNNRVGLGLALGMGV